MNNGTYRFKLENFTCICLSDGSLDYPLHNFFANVAQSEVEKALHKHNLPIDYITTPYTYLYIDTQQHRVLVDLGAGNLGPRTGKLLMSMETANVSPAEIDTVIITHAHPDHIGGMLNDSGKLNFANATYYISKVEWDFWFSEEALKKTSASFVTIARQNLGPIKDRVRLVEGEMEIVPGIHTHPAPGHTPGHMVVEALSGDANLFYIGDTVLYPLHLEHPDWLPIYDILPEQAASSKQMIFNRVADQRTLVVGQHFPPFPSLGFVVKREQGWLFQPIEVSS